MDEVCASSVTNLPYDSSRASHEVMLHPHVRLKNRLGSNELTMMKRPHYWVTMDPKRRIYKDHKYVPRSLEKPELQATFSL